MRCLIALAAVAAILFSPSARAFERLAKPESGSLLTRVNGHYGHYGHRHHSGNGFALMYYVHNYPRGISATFGAPRPCFCGSRW